MRLFHTSPIEGRRVKVYYSLSDMEDKKFLGYLNSDCSMPETMYARILKLHKSYVSYVEGRDATPHNHRASDIYTAKGQLKDLKIYSGVWKYTRNNVVISRKVDFATARADMRYFALCIAMRHDIEEGSIAFNILMSVIRSMYNDWKRKN